MVDKSPARIRQMFDDISPRYDFLNHVLSLNTDVLWRRKAAERCAAPADALDVCCGTGDMAIELRRRWGARVAAADFSHAMLARAAAKAARLSLPIPFSQADTCRLPFPDARFDAVTVAFGLRNVGDTARGLREMARVTRPGGRVVVLEFTTPPNRLVRPGYLFYFNRVLPLIGSLLSRSRTNAYRYLPASVGEWHSPESLRDLMLRSGLRDVSFELLTLGIAAIHVGIRA